MDSNVFVYKEEDETGVILVDEVYRVNSDQSLTVNPVGIWTNQSGLVWTKVPVEERRNDFQGITLSASTLQVQV